MTTLLIPGQNDSDDELSRQSVEATLDAYPDQRIPCHVIAIIPTADRQRATVEVRVGFDALDERILPDMMQKATRDPIENEAANGLSNVNGSIAMARTSAPHSATAQFFINVKDNSFLDHPGQDGWGYCVFGKVTGGMDVVEQIKGVDTTNKAGHSDVPVEPIVIEKAEIAE